MGATSNAGLAFGIRRLVREYGTALGGVYGTLSISGTVSPVDVYRAFASPTCYKLNVLSKIIKRRRDEDLVLSYLRTIISLKVEVIPVHFMVAKYRRSV